MSKAFKFRARLHYVYEAPRQPGLMFWAEPNEIDGGKTWIVTSQMRGFPATDACDDWFARFADADSTAKHLAQEYNPNSLATCPQTTDTQSKQ
jgi:hypothetical protein